MARDAVRVCAEGGTARGEPEGVVRSHMGLMASGHIQHRAWQAGRRGATVGRRDGRIMVGRM
ncbi:MAG: hypothetical protein RL077_3589 [Verrucomicrobiota bacterium]